jgi:hypothetical protein
VAISFKICPFSGKSNHLIYQNNKFQLFHFYSVQNLLSSRLISKNLKIKIYKTVILPLVLYGCETRSLSLREEHRLRAFENRVLRRIFGPKWETRRIMEKIA